MSVGVMAHRPPPAASSACPMCGNAESWPIPFRQDRQIDAWRAEIGDAAPYGWRLCRRCGNAYPSAQPDLRVLQRIWNDARTVATADPAQVAAAWESRRIAGRICAARSYRLFAPLCRSGKRFLDIACGLGDTVRIFADHGWDAEGIDADPNMLPFHRDIGICSRIGQFETLDIAAGYDIIHIAHAIYFITDPMGFMRRVRAHLAADGLFCLVISDFMASYEAGQPSYSHSFMPTAASLRHALALAGFATILERRWSGSIYLAARPAHIAPPPVTVWPILLGYRTKALRHAVIGRPYLALRQVAKRVLRRR